MEKSPTRENEVAAAFAELERSVNAALETYSNVHRGSGHNSMVSTHLFEQARDIVLEYLGLKGDNYVVIFCTLRRAAALKARLKPGSYQCVSSQDIGLSLGVIALAVKRRVLPGGPPLQPGGGTTRLVSSRWVIWAKAPDKFEAGTPAIINIIAFAKALLLTWQYENDIFQDTTTVKSTATEILYHDELDNYSGQELLEKLRQTLIGRGIRVPTVEGDSPFINLDNGASTPTFEPIWNTVCKTWQQPGPIQKEIIQETRSICAGMLGAPPAAYDVIFTSNTTEAINLVAESLSVESNEGIDPVVLNTLLEHTSNDLPWRMVPHYSMIRLEVDDEGFLDLNELDTILWEYNQKKQHGKKRIRMVAVSGASNVLGVFNNLEEISRIAHRYKACLLVDAAQLVAHRKVDLEGCGIDYLAFSAHKAYAPFGTGVLVVKKGLLGFSPAEMKLVQSSGEENAGSIAALGKSLVLLQRIGLDLIQKEEQFLTGRALQGLTRVPGLKIFGISNPDSPSFARKGGVIVFGMKGILSNVVAKELAEQGGIGVRSGCHCAHLLIKRLLNISPMLELFQRFILIFFLKLKLPGLTRVSLGIENSEADIDTLIRVLGKIARQARTMPGKKSASMHNGTPIPPQTDIQRQMNDFVIAASKRVFTR